MIFTKPIFIFFFFPTCVGGFYLLNIIEKKWNFSSVFRLKELFLICMSSFFYLWGAGLKGVICLVVYVVLVYLLGKFVSPKYDGLDTAIRKSKITVAIAIITLCSILFYYKYTTFVTTVISNLTNTDCIYYVLWVPLGISFITFSAISYIMDVFWGEEKCGTIIDVALYLTLFTKIISGPIVLWRDFNVQIKCVKINVDLFLSGINRIIIGFVKKLILADYFGLIILEVQNSMENGIDIQTSWICALLYTLQIYYDFAGYSDIAIGLSRILGLQFKENFNFPYISTSITEFWRRWHISLGTWFRIYIYIPLGGNRKGTKRTMINLGIVFIVTGIWHGAGWNYIFWGMLHGASMLIERYLHGNKIYEKIPTIIKWFSTMFIINIGWEAFRIQSFSALIDFYKIMFGIINFDEVFFSWQYFMDTKTAFLMLVGIIGATLLKWEKFVSLKERLDKSMYGLIIQESFLFVLLVISILCMVSSSYSPFIYFQY